MSRLESLPAEVLKLVMQHVNLRDRLLSCCLVSQRMHAAAVAATQRMELAEPSTDSVQSGLHWMSQYGQHVTKFTLSNHQHPVNKLPCPSLLDLQLWQCSVQLGPTADGQPGVVPGCTKLTRLEMCCNILDAPEGAVVDCLSSLVDLQHLSVLPVDAQFHHHCLGGLSSSTLQCLTRLTFLCVRSLSSENLAQLGGLINLKELHLEASEDGAAIGPSRAPGLTFPDSLTRFATNSGLEAATLSLLPAGLKDVELMDCVVEGPFEGPGSMLLYIERLQQLTGLELHLDGGWPPAGPTYSALTASSSLVSLKAFRATFPAGIWQYVFPPARKMLHLTHLAFADESVWSAADVSRLVSCCPNLCRVDDMHLHHGFYVSRLQELSALTAMTVTYPAADLAGLWQSVEGLAALTQLRRLTVELHSQEHMQVSSLLPLTSLTALTALNWSGDHQPHYFAFWQVIWPLKVIFLRATEIGSELLAILRPRPGP
jgi:hypothetical protein